MAEKISIKHRLEYFGYTAVEKFVLSVPDQRMVGVARFFAFLTFFILRIRRKDSINNLKSVFAHKDEKWFKITAYFSYLHFAMLILEFMKMARMSLANLRHKFRNVDLGDLVREVNAENGAVMISGHFGNWELAMGYFYLQGIRSAVIQRKQRNILVDNKMKQLREKWGMEILYPKGAVDASITALKNGKMIGLLGDQDAGKNGIFISFLGREASTNVGAAVLHLKTGAALYLGICTRISACCFDFKAHKIQNFPEKVVNSPNIEKVTTAFTHYLEKAVRKNPHQYFWMHRRWKTQRENH
jgi:KDO2-lipid IV(A) lauroyltransferase